MEAPARGREGGMVRGYDDPVARLGEWGAELLRTSLRLCGTVLVAAATLFSAACLAAFAAGALGAIL